MHDVIERAVNSLLEDEVVYASAGDIANIVGVGWQISKDIIDNRPDLKVSGHKRMEGYKYPNDDKSYHDRGTWHEDTARVFHAGEAGYIDTISAEFHVSFAFNGHAVGNIMIPKPVFNDALFWSLEVETNMKPESITYQTPNNPAIAAVRVVFDYLFYSAVRSVHRRKTLRLFGNGYVEQKTQRF